MLIEACAGLLEEESPEVRIRLELREETGYEIPRIRKVFEAYMSPGAVTEILHFFVAEYSPREPRRRRRRHRRRRHRSAGTAVRAALTMIDTGEIKDAKTIMLLQYAALNLFR